MNDSCINVVCIMSPGISQKTVFVRSDYTLDSSLYGNALFTRCDEIVYAKSYDRCPTFTLVVIVNGKRRVYTYHNITIAEVIYA